MLTFLFIYSITYIEQFMKNDDYIKSLQEDLKFPSLGTLYLCLGTLTVINLVKFIIDTKQIFKKYDVQDVFLEEESEMTLSDIKNFKLVTEEEFYSEKMIDFINKENKLETDKYSETAKNQIRRNNLKNYKEPEDTYLNKEDTFERLMYELEAYSLGTKSGPIEVS